MMHTATEHDNIDDDAFCVHRCFSYLGIKPGLNNHNRWLRSLDADDYDRWMVIRKPDRNKNAVNKMHLDETHDQVLSIGGFGRQAIVKLCKGKGEPQDAEDERGPKASAR